MEASMEAKPSHLSEAYARQFSDASVAAAYPRRPPYPESVIRQLATLIAGPARRVLDLGCGTGDIARRLAPLVDRVDAVDISIPMIELGKALPGGDDPRLRWILGRAEDAALEPPYGLVTAGEALHWMEWDVLLPRLARLLLPGGVVALVERRGRQPWDSAARELIARFSTNRDFRPYDLVDERTRRRLFTPLGELVTQPVASGQLVDDYIESFHSANGFSRERMTQAAADAFDRELGSLVAPYVQEGAIIRETVGYLRWGLPSAEAK
jgi:SAM-dependent methyltransferase